MACTCIPPCSPSLCRRATVSPRVRWETITFKLRQAEQTTLLGGGHAAVMGTGDALTSPLKTEKRRGKRVLAARLTELKADTKYKLRIKAYSDSGNSEWCEEVYTATGEDEAAHVDRYALPPLPWLMGAATCVPIAQAFRRVEDGTLDGYIECISDALAPRCMGLRRAFGHWAPSKYAHASLSTSLGIAWHRASSMHLTTRAATWQVYEPDDIHQMPPRSRPRPGASPPTHLPHSMPFFSCLRDLHRVQGSTKEAIAHSGASKLMEPVQVDLLYQRVMKIVSMPTPAPTPGTATESATPNTGSRSTSRPDSRQSRPTTREGSRPATRENRRNSVGRRSSVGKNSFSPAAIAASADALAAVASTALAVGDPSIPILFEEDSTAPTAPAPAAPVRNMKLSKLLHKATLDAALSSVSEDGHGTRSSIAPQNPLPISVKEELREVTEDYHARMLLDASTTETSYEVCLTATTKPFAWPFACGMWPFT